MGLINATRQIATIDVLSLIELLYPSYLWRAFDHAGQEVILLRFPRVPAGEALCILRQVFNEQVAGPTLYEIDLHHLDLLTPATSRALLLWADELRDKHGTPALFTHVRSEALQGLLDLHAYLRLPSSIWAMDDTEQPHIIGPLPDRLQEIVALLLMRGEVCACDLATKQGYGASKQEINRFSVYLLELFSTGLVVREKVPASMSIQGTRARGWTYHYRSVYSLLAKIDMRSSLPG